MGTSTALAVLIFTTCKVVYLTSTWSDIMNDGDGIDNALSISIPLETVGNGYKHKISIGSNNQDFDVMVTLSSSMLWVPRIGCTGAGSRKQFDSAQSASFTMDGRRWRQKSYGGTINGELGNDVTTIRGSVTQQMKPKCTFGVATSISADIKMTVDGVLGLAPSNDSSNPTPVKPFISQLIETKGLLNSPMFTIFLSQQSGSNAGSVTYGSRNAINCHTGSSTLQPFTHSYQFKISSISLGNFTHGFMNNAMPELISSITGPQADIDGLAKAAGAMPKLGSYEIQCDATVPKLEIKAERFTYTIQSNRLIVKIGNRCVLALAPQTSAGIGPQWHFGAPLLQEYCITFNLNTNNLEFFGVKTFNLNTNNLEFFGVKNGPTTTSSTFRTASTRKQNTTSTSKTTRKIPTTTPKNATSSSTKTTRRVLSTTPKLNITTSSTRTTPKLPTTTPKRNITTSSTRTTRRLPTTTPKKTTTSTRETTRRIPTTTPKRNITISSTRTTRRIQTTTPKKTTTSTRKTTRRIPTTTPKRNITTSSTRTTRRLPTTTPRKISTSSTKTTHRIISTTSRRNATTSRPRTTRRVLSTTPKRNVTTSRRFTTKPPVRTTTKKLAPATYLYCLFSFMLFSSFRMR